MTLPQKTLRTIQNNKLCDITNQADILQLVTCFYQQVLGDKILGPVFRDIPDFTLDKHLPMIAEFWERTLLGTGVYQRNTLAPHRKLNLLTPLTPPLFHRWLQLWIQVVDALFLGQNADTAKLQATRIAGAMSRRLNGRGTEPDQ